MSTDSLIAAPPEAETRVAASENGLHWTRQARELIDDLQQRSALIYWTDFLLSVGVAWALAFYFLSTSGWGPLAVLSLLASAILFFRAGTFIHEIIHFRSGELKWFARIWNLLMGIPLLMPWIFYRNHIEHHSVRNFGTPDDGEYLPLAAAPLRETVKYLMQAPLLPFFTVLRFGVMAPLSWLHRGLREWVLTAASAGVSNPYYRKRFSAADEWHLRLMEVLCFLWLLAIAVLLIKGLIDWQLLLKGYVLIGLTLTLNWVRNLAAHSYSNRGERMTLAEQFSDSINITGQTWLTVLMFPVGLRYHALHHLFPFLPYHNLGKAHARLIAQLPAGSPYHVASCTSYFVAVTNLWRSARSTAHKDSAITLWRQRKART
ncbi:MAG: fatty acid desaturase [Steroidobacteraceae bacterium]